MTTIKRFLTLFLIATISITAWGVEYTEITSRTSASVVSNSSYTAYTYKASDVGADTIDWVITFGGNNKSVGTNSGNRGNCKLTNYSKYAVSPVTTTSIASAFVSTTAISNVSKISYTFNGGSNQTSTKVYLIYSSNNTTFSKISLTSGTQGAAISSGTAYVFTECSGYFGLLFEATNSSGAWRIDDVEITLYRASATCTNTPTMSFTDETVNKTTDDVSYTQTVNISGKGSGQNVAYSSSDETIGTVNSSGVVSLKGKVGSTTITASVEASGTYCSASASYTINVTQAPIDVTLHYKGTSTTLSDQTNPYTLPTTGTYVEDACDEWKFAGWYSSEYGVPTASETKPTYITQMTATGHAYAVYKHTETSGSSSTPVTKSMNSFTSISGYVENDANISYEAGRGSAATDPGVYDGIIRIYQNGGILTITANNSKKISSITIGSSMVTIVDYSVDGAAAVEDNDISAGGTLTVDGIDASEVVFTCMGSDKNHRLYLNYLSVTYSDGGGTSTTTYSTDTDCRDCATPTLVFDNNTVNKFDRDAPFINPLTVTGNDMHAALSYTSSTPGKATVDADGNVTILDAMATGPITITATLEKADDGVNCQKKVTATYTLNIYNKVTWLVNGEEYTTGSPAPTTRTTEGGEIENFPDDPNGALVCDGKTFMGWTTSEYEGATKPTTLYTNSSTIHITENTTFHAVFAEPGGESEDTFRKGTSADLTDGKRVLIVNHNASHAMVGKETSYGLDDQSVTITDGKIKVTDESIVWTVKTGSTGYYFHQGDNYVNAGPDQASNNFI